MDCIQNKQTPMESMKAGQDIVIAGVIGISATKDLFKNNTQKIKEYYSSNFINTLGKIDTHKVEQFLLDKDDLKYSAIYEIASGGIFTALWDITANFDIGIRVELLDIPIRQETVELSELFEINPYYMDSQDAYILITDNGYSTVKTLLNRGIEAIQVGKVEYGKKRIIVTSGGIGFLERPRRSNRTNNIK
jgi:Hydrogenase maturation factor